MGSPQKAKHGRWLAIALASCLIAGPELAGARGVATAKKRH
jgi:hypothetical protein